MISSASCASCSSTSRSASLGRPQATHLCSEEAAIVALQPAVAATTYRATGPDLSLRSFLPEVQQVYQGGTVALEAVKSPGIAGAVVAFSSRYARLPACGARIGSRIHLVHGEFDSVVSRVYAERAARVLAGLHVPVTLDIVEDLGHALSHRAISLGSLRLLQGIYEGRRHTIH